MSPESEATKEILSRVEDSLKQLQVLIPDFAVLKAGHSALQQDIDDLKDLMFNERSAGHSIPDRLIRVEEFITAFKKHDIQSRVSNLERSAITKEECDQYHDKQFSRIWKVAAPLIVASILAIVAALYDVIKSPQNIPVEKQVEIMRELLQKELPKITKP